MFEIFVHGLHAFLTPFPPLQFNVEKKFRRRTADCTGSPSLARGDSRGKNATPRDFPPKHSTTLNSKGGRGGGRNENLSTLRFGGGGRDEGYGGFLADWGRRKMYGPIMSAIVRTKAIFVDFTPKIEDLT